MKAAAASGLRSIEEAIEAFGSTSMKNQELRQKIKHEEQIGRMNTLFAYDFSSEHPYKAYKDGRLSKEQTILQLTERLESIATIRLQYLEYLKDLESDPTLFDRNRAIHQSIGALEVLEPRFRRERDQLRKEGPSGFRLAEKVTLEELVWILDIMANKGWLAEAPTAPEIVEHILKSDGSAIPLSSFSKLTTKGLWPRANGAEDEKILEKRDEKFRALLNAFPVAPWKKKALTAQESKKTT